MALTGALQADFSDFVAESQKATAALATMEAEAKKTGTTFAKTGQVVDGFGGNAAGLQKLSQGLRTVDQSANAMGVSLAKPIGLIEEMSKVSGQSAAELGKLGTAAAVAGAALAGWNVGRWIAEMTGSDKAIGDATASILGWRDAGQAAGNNAEVLARALRVTGQVFTDVHAASEALRKASAGQAAQFSTTSAKVVEWEAAISKARGGADALRGEIAAGNLTVAEMVTRFNVSAAAIDYLKRSMALATAETDRLAAADKKAADEAQRHAEARQKLQDSMFGTDQITKANEAMAALGGLTNVSRMATDEQAKLNATVGEAIESLKRAGSVGTAAMNELYIATVPIPPVVSGLGSEWASVGEKVTVSADTIIAGLKRMTDETKAYEAETQRLADEWNTPKQKVDETTQAVNRLGASISQMVQQSSSELETLSKHYAYIANQNAGKGGGAFVTGHDYSRMWEQASRDTAAKAAETRNYEATVLGQGGAWGTTLNVNVNNADAQGIANKLVTEMRHNGVRF